MVGFYKLSLLKSTNVLLLRSLTAKSSFIGQPWTNKRLLSSSLFYSNQRFLKNENYDKANQQQPSNSPSNKLNLLEKCVNGGGLIPLRVSNVLNYINFQKNLTADKACTLLAACGKRSLLDASKRIHLANKIFDATDNKSVDLYNMLLQCWIENDKPIVTTKILQEMKSLNLQPDNTTYGSLIAGHCLSGDINGANQIVNFLKTSKLQIPTKVYGYIAYGLCKTDKPNDAEKIFQYLDQNNIKITWDEFSWLCRGLASSGNTELLKEVVTQYAPKIDQKMGIFHLMDIYKDLFKAGHEKDIELFLDYAYVTTNWILEASKMVKKMPIATSSYIIEALYNNCANGFDSASENTTARPVLTHMLQYPKKFGHEEIWDKMMYFKKFHPKIGFMEYFTLSLLLQQKSPHCKAFINKLIENNTEIKQHSVLPLIMNTKKAQLDDKLSYLKESNIDFVSQRSFCFNLKRLYNIDLNRLSGSDDSNSKSDNLESAVSFLEQVIFQSNFNPDSVMRVFKTKNSLEHQQYNTNLLCRALTVLVERHVSSYGDFKMLIHELQIRGLMFHTAVDAYLKSQGFIPQVPSTGTSQYHNSRKGKKNITMYLSQFKEVKTMFSGDELYEQLQDIIIDGKYHLDSKAFNTLLEEMQDCFDGFSSQMLCFILGHYIESSSVNDAVQFLKKYDKKINIVDTIYSSLWMKANAHTKMVLMEYLRSKFGKDKATWVVYCTLLKADQTKEAADLLSNSNISLSPSSVKHFLYDLALENRLVDKYEVIIDHCKDCKGFILTDLYIVLIKDLLKKNRDDEAAAIALKVGASSSPIYGSINRAYIGQRKLQPIPFLPKAFRPLATIIARKNIDLNGVFSQLSDHNFQLVFTAHDKNPFIVYHMLNKLFLRLPLHDFYPVCEKLKCIMPIYKPLIQSQIVINHIQRLIANCQMDEALKFSLENMLQGNTENFHIWEAVIHVFGKAALFSNRNDVLDTLSDSGLITMSQNRALICAYQDYSNLMQSNVTRFDKESSIVTLVKLLVHRNDNEMIEKSFDIVHEQFSESPSLLLNFLSATVSLGYKPRDVSLFLNKVQLTPDQITEVARSSYAMAADDVNLLNIDFFFRNEGKNCNNWHRFLNFELFNQFKYLHLTSYIDTNTYNYLEACVYKVPFSNNDPFVKSAYLDLCTGRQILSP